MNSAGSVAEKSIGSEDLDNVSRRSFPSRNRSLGRVRRVCRCSCLICLRVRSCACRTLVEGRAADDLQDAFSLVAISDSSRTLPSGVEPTRRKLSSRECNSPTWPNLEVMTVSGKRRSGLPDPTLFVVWDFSRSQLLADLRFSLAGGSSTSATFVPWCRPSTSRCVT